MRKSFYLPDGDIKRVDWLNNFAAKLATHAAYLNIPPATVTQTTQDAENFKAMITYAESYKDYGKAITSYKNLMSTKGNRHAPMQPMPPAPVLTFANPPVGDIFGRVRRLVQLIKNNNLYTQSIGADLGIIGSERTVDFSKLMPRLIITLNAGRPVISWKKGNMQGIKIYVDRGSGYQFLALDTQPDYTDIHPLPSAGQSAVWKYQAIYILNDEEVGNFGNESVVTVTGYV
jgi:hypothetical protein